MGTEVRSFRIHASAFWGFAWVSFRQLSFVILGFVPLGFDLNHGILCLVKVFGTSDTRVET